MVSQSSQTQAPSQAKSRPQLASEREQQLVELKRGNLGQTNASIGTQAALKSSVSLKLPPLAEEIREEEGDRK